MQKRPAWLSWSWLLAALSLALLLAHAWEYRFLTDDAHISFRYARNLAEGHGLVFNPGYERVEGYTNFLWVIILAALQLIGLAPEHTASALGLGLTVALWGVVLWYGKKTLGVRGGSWLLATVPLILLALTRSVAVWSTGGLETRLFELLVVWGALRLITEIDHALQGRSARPWSGLLLALGALTRPDGILIGLCAYGAGYGLVALRARRVNLRWLAGPGLFVVIVATHFVFRYAYYGDWLPNTYYAKVGGRTWWSMGFSYFRLFALEYGLLLLVPFWVAAVLRHLRRDTLHAVVVPAAIIIPHLLYVMSIGGDHFEYRPFDLYFPFLYLLLAEGLAELLRSRRSLRVASLAWAGLVLVGITLLPWQLHRDFPRGRYMAGFPGLWAPNGGPGSLYPRSHHLGLYNLPGLTWVGRDYRKLLYATTSVYVGLRAEEHAAFLATVVSEGPALRDWVARGYLPRDTYFATGSVGAIPYYSHLRTLDVLGLTDRVVAHSSFREERVLAHDKRAAPQYLQARGADFCTVGGVHLLYRTTEADFLHILMMTNVQNSPAFVAELPDGNYLFAFLPQGAERARTRFPRLTFHSVAEKEYLDGILRSAMQSFATQVAARPNDVALRREYARALRLLGQEAQARAEFERVLRSCPEDLDARSALGRTAGF